jgi:hypothetical protein
MFITFFTSLLNFINIPQIPTDILNSVNSVIDTIITKGSCLIDLFIPYNIAKTLLLIVIFIEIAIGVYHFVMWVIKKIPLLSIR